MLGLTIETVREKAKQAILCPVGKVGKVELYDAEQVRHFQAFGCPGPGAPSVVYVEALRLYEQAWRTTRHAQARSRRLT